MHKAENPLLVTYETFFFFFNLVKSHTFSHSKIKVNTLLFFIQRKVVKIEVREDPEESRMAGPAVSTQLLFIGWSLGEEKGRLV